jgi:hypothetical protein
MNPADIEEELIDIKRELDRLEKRSAPSKDIAPLRDRITAIEKHLGIR